MIRSTSSLLLWICMIIGASLMLYHTSDKVHALDKQLRNINAQIEDEQKSLHVLKAEWVYLANPARIETKAKRHLKLKPTDPKRIAGLNNFGDLLPIQEGSFDTAPLLAETKTKVIPSAKTEKPVPAPVFAEVKKDKPRTKHDRILASLNEGRINDRIKIQRAASTITKPDRLDAVIRNLGLRP